MTINDDPTMVDDASIIGRLRRGDQQALTDLYDRYASAVYGMAWRVLNNRVLAEEATQDTFIKVWENADRWQPERGKFSSWLLTIARYTAIDRLRLEKRLTPSFPVDVTEMREVIGEESPLLGDLRDNAEMLGQLIGELSDVQIEAIELSFFHGMTHAEISEHLQVPLGTIKSRIRDGLTKLRRLWELNTQQDDTSGASG